MIQRALSTYGKRFGAIAALIISSALAIPVQAQDWKAVGEFGWFGVGKAYEIDKGHFYWVGEFTGTFISDKGKGGLFHHAGVKCPAYNDLNFPTGKGKAGGYCVIIDKDGDKAYLSCRTKVTVRPVLERLRTPAAPASTAESAEPISS